MARLTIEVPDDVAARVADAAAERGVVWTTSAVLPGSSTQSTATS
jgi:hypothetical protein